MAKITVESGTETPRKVGSSQEKVIRPLPTCANPKLETFMFGKPYWKTVSKEATVVLHVMVPCKPTKSLKCFTRTGTTTWLPVAP